jgi:glycosyltransferase involved in cell wall biosynthesis
MRVIDLARQAPVNISHGATAEARESVRRALMASKFDVVVFDFVHATELMPDDLGCASVCFTHNVEAEIFERHAQTTRGTPMGWVWASQAAKMRRYEREAMRRYTRVVAVSERDAKMLAVDSGKAEVDVIPTAVDLDFFSWAPPAAAPAQVPTVAFTGSMDWAANVDGVEFFLGEVWPLVLRQIPNARFVVIGRNPPASLQRLASATQGVELTGFVDDVRPHVRGAQAFVIPLRVGGGTRIKAFEAMAMGCPVVSTAIGIEGLEVEPDRHYLLRDTPAELAQGVIALLTDAGLRQSLSAQARQVVEQRFGHLAAARVFEAICLKAATPHAEPAAAGEPCAA